MVSAFFLWLKYNLKTLGSYFSLHTLNFGCHYTTGMDKEEAGRLSPASLRNAITSTRPNAMAASCSGPCTQLGKRRRWGTLANEVAKPHP